MSDLGIRREDKHEWERRVPLTPEAVRGLVAEGLAVTVQPSPIRAFGDDDYRAAGATVAEELIGSKVVFAVKEIPARLLRRDGAYVFFSHTIKGQAHNMPLLRRLMELGCTLIDYEKITDASGRRLVLFGYHAGLAGMIDTLAVTGQRLAALGHANPFASLQLAHRYADLDAARAALGAAGEALKAAPLPEALRPFVVGFAGYGNVSRGAQEILALLPTEEVSPAALQALVEAGDAPGDRVYKVVFKEEHLVEPRGDEPFELQTYYQHPERFRSIFAPQLHRLNVLINAIYWTEAYPRLVEREALRSHTGPSRLQVIGDISCDIEGAVECTLKATTPGAPAYVYDPATGSATDGVEGPGIAMMTTDCLPCELPRESSAAFSAALAPLAGAIARADYSGACEDAGLPPEIARATILWRGQLRPDYAYLEEFLGG